MSFSIALIIGSLRRDSFNRRLAHGLTKLPDAQGIDFVWPEIGDLPLYNQDDDASPPAQAVRLKMQIREADAVIFVSPEYNRSIPGVLKNALDHGSRPHGDSVWAKKPAGVIGTSQGATGTCMAQQHLRNVVAYLDMPTLNSPEAFIRFTDDLIDAEGRLAGRTGEFIAGWFAAFLAHARHNHA